MSDKKHPNRGTDFKEWLARQPEQYIEGPDGNVHCIPTHEIDDHIESEKCWCEPEVIQDARDEGGCIAYLHRERQ